MYAHIVLLYLYIRDEFINDAIYSYDQIQEIGGVLAIIKQFTRRRFV